ncbi:hypothetical protein [Streptomyces sp. NBC_01187]|uniref:hypothetical protein n=1 Tax=Streptomyces sp. NBC_01187 TaxID=2903766 RepID=UPI002F909B2C|nr:hypothetical protein OG220_40235 [Streptomyces sp. NBC_01187]WSS46987.1 hypothetical protein OG220_41390 [Streptomyces sp. NBC_01187]
MDYRPKARRARLRLVVLGTAVAALVTGGGVLALDNAGGNSAPASKAKPSPGRDTAGDPANRRKKYTPATARSTRIVKPKSAKNGIGTGFPHTATGATSAAVSYWEDLSLIDDQAAGRQLRTVAVQPSDPVVQKRVSEVRTLREKVGLPPSGGPPNEITFTTDVKAVLARSHDSRGDVVQVWMAYDCYATSPKQGTDDNPLKNQTDNLILTWRGGDWRVTQEPAWVRRSVWPPAYDPHSFSAFQAGWREVTDA